MLSTRNRGRCVCYGVLLVDFQFWQPSTPCLVLRYDWNAWKSVFLFEMNQKHGSRQQRPARGRKALLVVASSSTGWPLLHLHRLLFLVATTIVIILPTVHGRIQQDHYAGPRLYTLHPTAALQEERRQRQRQRRRMKHSSQRMGSAMEIPEQWLHPQANAIYATLHGGDVSSSSSSSAAKAKRDFDQHRHLSRYERHLRNVHQLDLQLGWSGHYSDFLATHPILNANVSDYNDNYNHSYNNNSDHSARHRHLSMLYGGQFNNYQAVPLSQGYGTHYVHMWVGSPVPQRQTVIVDTGSHFTAFPCVGCKKCGPEHHTDPHFDPSESQSFYALPCGKCHSSTVASCHTPDNTCHFTQSYTEGSSWEAYQARDLVYCGGSDILEAANPMDHQMTIPFMFGCLLSETGLFVTQLADGIMGMSAHETTLPKQLYNAQKLEHNVFAMCFRRELGTSKRGVTAGSMTLGGVTSSLDTSPMVYAKNMQSYGWYTVFVKNIYIAKRGGSSNFAFPTPNNPDIVKVPIDVAQVNSGKGVIVDSGTTDTYLNVKIQKAFAKVWKQVTGMEYTHGPVYLTQSQLLRLPTILIQCAAAATDKDVFDDGTKTTATTKSNGQLPQQWVGHAGMLDPTSPKDLILAIPATHYMEYSPALKLYTSRLYFTETRGGVLGANAMQGHNVLFDWENGRVGFAESSCAYDMDTANQDGTSQASTFPDMSFGRDCHLSHQAMLTKACAETVDTRLCWETDASKPPSNVILLGEEIWTRLVENPGMPHGRTCGQAAAALHPQQQLDPSKVECAGDGICWEYRPCEISCRDAIAAQQRLQQLNATTTMTTNTNTATTLPSTMTTTATTTTTTTSTTAFSLMDEQLDSQPTSSKSSSSVPLPVTENNKSKSGHSSSSLKKCGDTFWSACDYSCLQSRLISTSMTKTPKSRRKSEEEEEEEDGVREDQSQNKDDNGGKDDDDDQICVQTTRMTRPCHIDACGRSDPCRVPFLVHAIFAFSGAFARIWTKEALATFTEALVEAVHAPDFSSIAARQRLFEAGDVDVLAVRPWYTGEENDELIALQEDEVSDQELGLKLVVQISMFNVNAHSIATKKETRFLEEKGGGQSSHQPLRPRGLLQAIGEMMRNMTSPIFPRKKTPESTCEKSDLYPLAKNAVEIANGILEHPNFASKLIEKIQELETARTIDSSPFENVYTSARHREASRMVSSWTIDTQVYDDHINYLGPIAMAPYLFLFRVLYEASLIFLLISFLSCILQQLLAWIQPMEHKVVMVLRRAYRCFKFPSWWRGSRYQAVPLDDYYDDDDNHLDHDDEDDSLTDKLTASIFSRASGNSSGNNSSHRTDSTATHRDEIELTLSHSFSDRATRASTTKRRNSFPIK